MKYTFHDLHTLLKRARSVYAGKPFGSNTRIMLESGTIDAPTCIAIKFYSTEILKYYPDGTIDVCTRWTTVTTLARLREYTHINIYMTKLPSVNGRRPNLEKTYMMKNVVFDGINGYIRVLPNGEIDMDSVKAQEIDVVTHTRGINKLYRKAQAIAGQIHVRARLGITFNNYGQRVQEAWLSANINTPLDEINYTNAPYPLELTGKPLWFAKIAGATKTLQFKQMSDLACAQI